MGVSGACRREELVKMMTNNVEDMGTVLIVKVPDTKTHVERTFTVSKLEYIETYRKYLALRPKNVTTNRLFLKYYNGRCYNQPVGINKMGQIPSLIGIFLGKESAKQFTGHCFRRTSATLLANAGGDITSVKRHGGWKSTSVAESYIEDCLTNKINISNKILDCPPSTSRSFELTTPPLQVHSNTSSSTTTATSLSGVTINNCSNCTFNFTFQK